jgi:hypothetical protein
MGDIILSGLQGMQRAEKQAAIDSQRVVQSFLPEATEDPVQPLVDLKVDQFQYSASAKVVRIGEEMWRSTLSILA